MIIVLSLCLIIILLIVTILNKTVLHIKEIKHKKQHRFAADVAHELRTPLAAIKTQAQIALNSTLIEDKDQAIVKLLYSVDRSTRIIQQLLVISHLSSTDEFSLIDLGTELREVSQMLTPLSEDKKIHIQIRIDDDLPLLFSNKTAIGILMHNLLDNAIRYSPEKTTITARIYVHKKNIILEINDQGPGIPRALYHRVFERFFRVSGHSSPGCGLGLAIVHDICTHLHAHIILKPAQKKSRTTLPGLCVKIYFRMKKLRKK